MYDVIVIGAGPAGIMASITAAKRNKKVLLIERNEQIGKKLLLTGGTRCNITNLKSVEDFIKEIPVNKKFLYSTLNNFSPKDIYNYLKSLNIDLKIEDNDRVFPKSNKASDIVSALEKELIKYNVKVNLNERVEKVEQNEVVTNKSFYKGTSIIITTGGYSYPKTGSTGDGHRIAKKLNHTITELYPSETFLITKETLPLEGIAVESVVITLNKQKAYGALLFTHKGLSGPAALKISEYVYKELKEKNNAVIKIDLLPNYSLEDIIKSLNNYDSKKEVKSFTRKYLQKRLADYIVDNFITNKKIAELSNKEKEKLLTVLKSYEIEVQSTGSLEQAFVTGGGIDVKEINPKTMQSKINKNIYFAGEIINTHGHIGGYNLTIALSTGYNAGTAV